jgi:outer membrane protein TolC
VNGRRLYVSIALALIAASSASTRAQEAPQTSPLTLQQAVSIALEKNPTRKAALADTKVASWEVKLAQSAVLPRLTFSETATRGNDPVYVFGSELRQQRFTTADFALNKLNTPTPIGNFSTRFGGSWTLFDSFASWHGITRAKLMNEAAAHQFDRTEQEIVFHVVEAYHAVWLADKQLEVAEQAAKTAAAILTNSQARFDSGLSVESDLLSAKVRGATRQQELIRATHNVSLAQAELNTAMGVPIDSPFHLDGTLQDRPLPIPILEDAEKNALTNRPDLKRIQSEESAQHQNVSMAKSSFGPRVNAFAGWEMDNPTLFAGGGGNNWVGGIELQVDIFQGGAKRAELSRQRALEQRVAALKQVASDGVRLDVRRAYYDMDASRQQVQVAQAAIAQAQENLRINQDRYEGGLTTITDLLGAEEAARRSHADYWDAVYRYRTSYASLELASGTLTPQSRVVTQ